MRKRLILLGVLCALLTALRAFPEGSIPAVAASDSLIWIDLSAMNLTLYQHGKQVGRWPIAGGKRDTPTPIGVYRINRRFLPDPSGFGTRFLGLNVPWGQYGIHGTNRPDSIGSRASHGCIRMFNKDVEALFRLAPNWTRVVIEDSPYGGIGWSLPTLKPLERGSAVVVAQQRLQRLGYYAGSADGIYGAGLFDAVRRFRKDKGLSAVNRIDAEMWDAMGVILFE